MCSRTKNSLSRGNTKFPNVDTNGSQKKKINVGREDRKRDVHFLFVGDVISVCEQNTHQEGVRNVRFRFFVDVVADQKPSEEVGKRRAMSMLSVRRSVPRRSVSASATLRRVRVWECRLDVMITCMW